MLQYELAELKAELQATKSKLELSEAEQELVRMDVGSDLRKAADEVTEIHRAVEEELQDLRSACDVAVSSLEASKGEAELVAQRAERREQTLRQEFNRVTAEVEATRAALTAAEAAKLELTAQLVANADTAERAAEQAAAHHAYELRQKDSQLAQREKAMTEAKAAASRRSVSRNAQNAEL